MSASLTGIRRRVAAGRFAHHGRRHRQCPADARHPSELAAKEVRDFLTWLAVERNVAASTQNQALNGLVFLFGKVLEQPLGDIGDAVRAKRPPRLPVVLQHDEAMAIIAALKMPYRLMVSLMYGAGLHVLGRGFAGVRSPLG